MYQSFIPCVYVYVFLQTHFIKQYCIRPSIYTVYYDDVLFQITDITLFFTLLCAIALLTLLYNKYKNVGHINENSSKLFKCNSLVVMDIKLHLNIKIVF